MLETIVAIAIGFVLIGGAIAIFAKLDDDFGPDSGPHMS